MSPFSLSLPFAARSAIVTANLGRGPGEAALLCASSPSTAVTDGLSNTMIFGEAVGRLPGVAEMASVWGAPDRLRPGFGLLLPIVAPADAQSLSLNFEKVQSALISSHPAAGSARRGFKVNGMVTAAAAVKGVPGLFGVWIQPMSIIGVLIGL